MRQGNLVMQKKRSELSGENLEKLYMNYMAGVSE